MPDDSMPDDVARSAADRAARDDELERLRELVGPSEIEYRQLRADLAAAQQLVREAEQAAGVLRGDITEMSVQLARARQDQDVLQRRAEMTGWGRIADRTRSRWRTSVMPRLDRIGAAVRRNDP